MLCLCNFLKVPIQQKSFTNRDHSGVGLKEGSKVNINLCSQKTNTKYVSISAREEVRTMVEIDNKQVEELKKLNDGLGIVNFIKDKVFLITGATGSLGKILIEKILRTVPNVGKMYLLIRECNEEEEAMERIQKEIISTDLFKHLKEIHGQSFQKFIVSKLVPVVGNLCEINLGIQLDLSNKIASEVDVVINLGANTTLNERYDVSLAVNTLAPSQLLSFAKRCEKLKLFMHLSTAYVNGERKGIISEKHFELGDSIAKENASAENHPNSFPILDVEAELRLAWDATENLGSQEMKDLGMERAKIYGWQNTYLFTKAMGEMMITSQRDEIPLVIIRPSMIESTYKEPIKGWIEGIRVMDPILVYYAKGELTGFPVDVDNVVDIVPADMVVNAILAAMAKHASTSKPEVRVYHVGSSVVNPLLLRDMFTYFFEYYTTYPYIDSKKKPINIQKLKLFDSMNDFISHVESEVAQRVLNGTQGNTSSRRVQKLSNTIKNFAKLYEAYMFYKARFDSSNTEKLQEEMSHEEKRIFGFDVNNIDWKEYICKVHIPGVMTHVLKGRGM